MESFNHRLITVDKLSGISVNHSLATLKCTDITATKKDRIWHSNEGDCQSCSHQVKAHLKEYLHQSWVSSQVSCLLGR